MMPLFGYYGQDRQTFSAYRILWRFVANLSEHAVMKEHIVADFPIVHPGHLEPDDEQTVWD